MSDIDELLKRLHKALSLIPSMEGALQEMPPTDRRDIRNQRRIIQGLQAAQTLVMEQQADLAASCAANASEFKRGQEVMMEAAARYVSDVGTNTANSSILADEIRKLPIGE